MKRIITITTFILITFKVIGQESKQVNTETLNIREGAGKEYNVVGKVDKGDKVNALSESGGWTKIETETGLTGFVATKYLSSATDEAINTDKNDSTWFNILVVLGVVGYGLYKLRNFFSDLFGGNSSSSQRSFPTKTYSQPEQSNTFHLSIKNGVVNLGMGRGIRRSNVFNYRDKAIDCDLEDPKDEQSRFLVVTTKGEVILCRLNSTGKDFVYRPSSSYGSAYKARFADFNSFIFTTEKGTVKGYFNSTQKDRLY